MRVRVPDGHGGWGEWNTYRADPDEGPDAGGNGRTGVAIGGGEEVNVVRESLNGVPYLQKGQRVGFTLKQGVNGNWAQDVIRLR